MDNASIHHVQDVTDTITATGALLRFLPTYSPDLKPIELAFSNVKGFLKANTEEVGQTFCAREQRARKHMLGYAKRLFTFQPMWTPRTRDDG